MTTTADHAPLPSPAPRSLMHRITVLLGPLGGPLAGTRWFPLWAILRHTGRKSGSQYAIPIVALPTNDGFVIPLPFGDRTQWMQNVLAGGKTGIRSRGHEYTVSDAAVAMIDDDAIATAIPRPLRAMSRRLGITRWVRVRRAP